jgi:cysteine desulfurase
MSRRIYLDHHATTPVDPRVVAAMLPWFTDHPGNASSPHEYGWEAREAVERARTQIAEFLDTDPTGIVFTGSATESVHLALVGLSERRASRGRHLVTTAFEHPAVLETVRLLEARGFTSTIVEVGRDGLVDPRAIAAALRDDTIVCSVMWANNEIGTVQPMAEIAALCHERGVLVHSDACQAIGRVPVSVHASGVDLLTLSGHKMYAPKGIAALAIRRQRPQVRLQPQLVGGGQQDGLRSGTLPVPLIVALGEACAIAEAEMAAESVRLLALRTRLLEHFTRAVDGVTINGDLDRRLPGNLSVSFAGVEAEAILLALPGLGLSVGSACSASHAEPSHVLRALGLRDEAIHATLRFGLGRTNTPEEIDEAAAAILAVVQRLRATSPIHRAVRSGNRAESPLEVDRS